MDNTKTYQIDKHKQLIPLNGSTVHFSCFFEVKSKDNKPFNITIVEQSEIKPKQYKLVENGYINGQIESDGKMKSYYLVLKSQQPCECNVRITLKPKQEEPLPPQSTPTQPAFTPQQQPQKNQEFQSYNGLDQSMHSIHTKTETSLFQPKYILGISIALIVVYLLYKYKDSIFKNFNTKDILLPSMSNTSF